MNRRRISKCLSFLFLTMVMLTGILQESQGGGICVAAPIEPLSKHCVPSPDGDGDICEVLGDRTAPKCSGYMSFLVQPE